jgi:hypothetical protein
MLHAERGGRRWLKGWVAAADLELIDENLDMW